MKEYYSSSYSRGYYSSRNYSAPVKPTTFQITLYSATGVKINTWTGTAIRRECGGCKFYDEKTGTLVQIIGTVVIE